MTKGEVRDPLHYPQTHRQTQQFRHHQHFQHQHSCACDRELDNASYHNNNTHVHQNGRKHHAATFSAKKTSVISFTQCAACGRLATTSDINDGVVGGITLRACSGCMQIAYCTKDCQKQHWKLHKSQCFIDQAKNNRVGFLSNDKRRNQITNSPMSWSTQMNDDEIDIQITIEHNNNNNHRHHHHHHHHHHHNGDNNEEGNWDRTIADLWRTTELIQRQHEAIQRDLNSTILALAESLRTFNIPIPSGLSSARRSVRSKQINSVAAPTRTPEHLLSLWQRCNSSSEKVQLAATKECRKLLSDQHPPIKELVEMGLIPIFVAFLRRKNSKLQFEAAWVLTNICSGTSEQTQAVIESGAVSALIELLLGKDEELSEQCVWALGNIAADSPTCRDILLEHGIVEALIPLLGSNRVTMLKNISWTMSNLCNGVRECYWSNILSALREFSRLLFCSDEEILKDVCWSLSYLSGATKDSIQAIVELIDPLVCKRLVELLTHRSPSVQHAALIAVGNIVTGDDEQTQILIDHQILPRLRRLLTSNSKTSILKDTCFTLSNIAAGNQHQIQALIDAKVIPALIHLNATAKYEVKVEATWALSNALSNGTDPQIRYLVNNGCVRAMCDILLQCDLSTIEAVIEGFEHVLRVGESEPDGNAYVVMMRNECLSKVQKLFHQITEPYLSAKLSVLLSKLLPDTETITTQAEHLGHNGEQHHQQDQFG